MRTAREKRNVTADQLFAETGVKIPDITSWEVVKNLVTPRLVDVRETEYLEGKPHIMVADIPVIYDIAIGKTGSGYMSAPVTDKLMEKWGITLEELDRKARENISVEMMPFPLLLANIGFDEEIVGEDMGCPIFFLSNETRNHGASSILRKDVMDHLCEQMGGEIGILPSSVHEVLIVKADENFPAMVGMVREINATVVEEDDRLSDNVYIYSPEKGLRVA